MREKDVKVTVTRGLWTIEVICRRAHAYDYFELADMALDTLEGTEGLRGCLYPDVDTYLNAVEQVYLETQLSREAGDTPVRLTAPYALASIAVDVTHNG